MSSVEFAARLGSTHEVKFFDTNASSEPFINSLIENQIEYSLLHEASSAFIINKYRWKLSNFLRYFIYIFKWNRTRRKVHAEMLQYQPEIVMVYDDRSLSYLSGFRSKKFKVLYYARGWYTPDQISVKMRIVMKTLVDILICVSESTRQALYSGGIGPLDSMHVIHNAIDKAKLSSSIEFLEGREADFKIILSGGFLPSKGHHVALEAALLLKERIDHFHLYLCGIIYPGHGDKSQKYYEELKQYVSINKLESHISFIVGKSDIISYMNYADIMFFPSSSEGLPRSVMEAMTLGKPVIANAVGGVTDLILDRYTGLITNYNDPEEYAEFAELLYRNTELYQEISKNASALIEKSYTEEMQIEKVEKIFNTLRNER